MASLLGGEYCIESLRRDVQDLQSILDEIHSRIGQVKYQSWQFPDKASCDVDVRGLIDRCKYSTDDEEECQMSHIMLYDLVIDRLVYLLQSFICFNEILLNAEGGNFPTSPSSQAKKGGAIHSMSIGLSVKKCWARITQIATLMQKLAKEVNSRPSRHSSSTNAYMNMKNKGSDEELTPNVASDKKPAEITQDKDVSCDVRCIGCQTVESAYSTCETCAKAQECLHDVGRALVGICKEQSLPTALEDYQSRYNDGVAMSVADLFRWAKHQSKDISRISRHMSSLIKQVNPLKADLATAIKSGQNAETKLQTCQSVFDRKQDELREEFRRKEYVLKEAEKDLKKKISTLETIKSNMQEEIDRCKWKMSDLKDELLQKHRDHLSLENSLAQFKEEAMEGQQYKRDAIKFKTELARVNDKVEELQKSTNHDKQLYERERTKNENMAQHEKMLQDKQKTLLFRMESANEECEKLRERIMSIEEERDAAILKIENEQRKKPDKFSFEIQNPIDSHEKEISSLRDVVESLRSENKEMQAAIAEYGERERLIVVYPDLNQENVKSPMIQGSGDVLADMRNQMEANNVRIEILQKENDALKKTLRSVESSTAEDRSPDIYSQQSLSTTRSNAASQLISEDGPPKMTQSIQLWKTSDIPLTYDNDGRSNRTGSSAEQRLWENLGTPRSSKDGSYSKWERSRRKPPSGTRQSSLQAPNRPSHRRDVPEINGIRLSENASYSSSSIDAYKKIKQQQHHLDASPTKSVGSAFTVGAGRRPKSGRPSSAKSALFKPWT